MLATLAYLHGSRASCRSERHIAEVFGKTFTGTATHLASWHVRSPKRSCTENLTFFILFYFKIVGILPLEKNSLRQKLLVWKTPELKPGPERRKQKPVTRSDAEAGLTLVVTGQKQSATCAADFTTLFDKSCTRKVQTKHTPGYVRITFFY